MSDFANEQLRLIGEYADEKSLPISEAIDAMVEWIEDRMDIIECEKELKAYEADHVSIRWEDVKKELGLP
jgi:uncharacterized protein YutD